MSQTDEFWDGVLTLSREIEQHSYYDLLGVESDATPEIIGQAYYAQVRRLHPDRHTKETDPELKDALVRLYARVGEAYRVLASPEQRKAYDEALTQGQNRLLREKQAAAPRPKAPDPNTPQGRALYERGQELLAKGDKRGARAQWDLAIQFEPKSEVIRRALDALDGKSAPPPADPDEGEQDIDAPVADADQAAEAIPDVDPAHSEVSVPGYPFPEPSEAPAPVPLRCKTWEQVDSLYHRKICRDGLSIRSAYAPPVGTEIPLAVYLPDGRTIAMQAEVNRVGPGRKPGKSSILLSFANLPQEIHTTFESVIAETQSSPPPVPDTSAVGDDDETLHSWSPTRREGVPSARVDDAALGRQALARAHYAVACEHLARALEHDPDSDSVRAMYYVALGYQTQATGNAREAQIHYQTALKLDVSAIEWLK